MDTGRASASSVPRRPSLDDDRRLSTSSDTRNVFSDGYAESFAESYADSADARSIGRRSSVSSDSSPSTVTTGPVDVSPLDAPRRPPHNPTWTSNTFLNGPSRLSTRKSLGARPVPSLDDAPPSPSFTSEHTNNPPSTTRRSPSTASSLSFARSMSPFQPNDGPSHPYGMYPQALGVSRSASAATASTLRSPTIAARQSPAHPYTLYPQDVSASEVDHVQQQIPVGFPGHSDNFHRRLGPEGEEQDLVGVDGHAEQLPPYSRFPEETSAKVVGAGLPPIGETGHESQLPENPFVSPIERGQLQQQQQQTLPAQPRPLPAHLSPIRPQESPLPHSTSEQSTKEYDEKSWKAMSWKERRQQKIFGVMPIWCFLLLVAVVIVIAAICGGVIGALVANQKDTDDGGEAPPAITAGIQSYLSAESVVLPVPTTMVGARPVTTMPTLPPLPTGVYQVDVGEAYFSSGGCLEKSAHKKSWSCSLEPDTFNVNVTFDGANPVIALWPYHNPTVPQYGTQPPPLVNQTLTLAVDYDNPDWGSAWQFQLLYDKLVVVDSHQITANAKRSLWPPPPRYSRKSVQPEDDPWFCYWNQTLLEGFIYVENDTVSAAAAAASSSVFAASSTSLPLAAYPSSSITAGQVAAEVGSSTTAPTPMPSPISFSSNTNLSYADFPLAAEYETPYDGPFYGAAVDIYKRQLKAPGICPLLPKRFKLVERRQWHPVPTAYCQQMTTGSDGVMRVKRDEYNAPITFDLIESVLPPSRKRDPSKRDLSSDGCFCQWKAT